LAPLWTHYPSDLPAGSPFNTGYFNALSPQFKRLAATQGDIVFAAPRRFFLSKTSNSMKAWSYCMSFSDYHQASLIRLSEAVSKRQKFVPFAGSVRIFI
jgi:hypothetical protein